MSYPILYPPAMTFGSPSSAQTVNVTSAGAETGRPYTTTSGARFRCSANLNIEKFLCSQCSGDRSHIAEAQPLQPWSSVTMRILDVTPEDVRIHLIADSQCIRRDDPRSVDFHLEDSKLTNIAQTNEVVCAHDEDGHECGRKILLSELPRHHFYAHRPRPLPSNARPQMLFSGQTKPEDAAASSLYPNLAACGESAAPAAGFGSTRGVGVFGMLTSPTSPGAPPPKEQTPPPPPPKITMLELTKRIEEIEKGIGGNIKSAEDNKKGVEDSNKKIKDLEKTIVDMKQQCAALVEQNKHLQKIVAQCLPSAEERQFSPLNTGTIRWKLENFRDDIAVAKNGFFSSFSSNPFYTTAGYMVSAVIFPNGDRDDAIDKAVSLHLCIMKTDFDEYLVWPFNHLKVTMSVIGSKGQELMQHQFQPDPESSSFLRPTGSQNIPSGNPFFIMHKDLDNFMVGADLLLKITVDRRPRERSDETGG